MACVYQTTEKSNVADHNGFDDLDSTSVVAPLMQRCECLTPTRTNPTPKYRAICRSIEVSRFSQVLSVVDLLLE